VIHEHVFESRDLWLEGRKPAIGSSEIAALVGMGYACQSPYQLWAQKTGKVKVEFDKEAQDRMNAGQLAEPLTRFMFEAKSGLKCYFDEKPTIRTNDDYPAFAASLDGWTHDDNGYAVVELKLINPRDLWQYQVDELPEKFQLQLQLQMAVMNCQYGYLCVACGTECLVIRIERCQRMIYAMHSIATEFLRCVELGIAPTIDCSEATKEVIKRQWPEMKPGQIVELSDEFKGMADRRDRLKAIEKRAGELSTRIDSRIKAVMQDAEYAIDSDGNCYSWRNGAKSRTFLRLNSVPPAVRIYRASREAETSV
jgi:putative phage-type endonuclease